MKREPNMDQKIGFCTTSDGVRIAYATVGEGPILVKAPNWMSHLEFEWQSPVWSHWWEELSKHHQVIRFDQRGSGLSDWNIDDFSFDSWVSDLEAVVEEIGLDKFSLIGISQGSAVAVAYATRHPEKVERLIIYGGFARGRNKRGMPVDEAEAVQVLIRRGWGRDNAAYRQIFTSQFMPGATSEQMDWFNELQRISTSPENAANISQVSGNIDVLDLLPKVQAETLVLHARHDERIPLEQGRQFAALIPNARFVTLESKNHLLIASEPAWEVALAEVRKFLGVNEMTPVSPSAESISFENVDGLTPREFEVLLLIATGKSNRDIAQELFISFHTVTNHVKNILGKTGSANRTEAAAYAIVRGLSS